MNILSLLIVLFSWLLLKSGSLAPWLIKLILFSATLNLLFHFVRYLLSLWRIHASSVKEKAKWASSFLHLAGLPLMPYQQMLLMISRKDELVFQADDFEKRLPISEIEGILNIRSDQLRHLEEETFYRKLERGQQILLDSLDQLFARYGRRHHLDLLLLLIKDETEQKGEHKDNLLVLENNLGSWVLPNFFKRPEIKAKAFKTSSDTRKDVIPS